MVVVIILRAGTKNSGSFCVQNLKKNKKMKIKSPLRYPGGKSRFVKLICPLLGDFDEYREPFAGGASIFFALHEVYGNKKEYWLNDNFPDLAYFYRTIMTDPVTLIQLVRQYRNEYKDDGRKLYKWILSEYDNAFGAKKAAFFYILNRITFSGLAYCGGYSQEAFEGRFTESSIDRLIPTHEVLKDAMFTGIDYEVLTTSPPMSSPDDKIAIYLDPPYDIGGKVLYGNRGDKHKHFDFERFASVMQKCQYKYLISLNDTERIKSLFKFANIYEYEKWHCIRSDNERQRMRGELLISNFEFKFAD